MKLNIIFIVILGFAISTNAYSGSVITKIPGSPDTSKKYIFYLHGSVEEDEGSTEKYETAIEAIGDSDATVISEVRGATDPIAYAEQLKSDIEILLSKGVPANNITISGFSKGSIIALASAGTINNSNINYVLLAGCSSFLNNKYKINPALAKGRILSIYDSSDEKFGTCEGIINSSDNLVFEEIELDSGKGHKLFRIPKEKFIEQWRDPLVDWADA
jgi:hypothetical protein